MAQEYCEYRTVTGISVLTNTRVGTLSADILDCQKAENKMKSKEDRQVGK